MWLCADCLGGITWSQKCGNVVDTMSCYKISVVTVSLISSWFMCHQGSIIFINRFGGSQALFCWDLMGFYLASLYILQYVRPGAAGLLIGIECSRVRDSSWHVAYLFCNYPNRGRTSCSTKETIRSCCSRTPTVLGKDFSCKHVPPDI